MGNPKSDADDKKSDENSSDTNHSHEDKELEELLGIFENSSLGS